MKIQNWLIFQPHFDLAKMGAQKCLAFATEKQGPLISEFFFNTQFF
jgi:hypothetical protein